MDAIFQKYVAFRNQIGRHTPFFLVSVDVEKCFDTMKPDLVMQIAEQTLQHDEYAVSTKAMTFMDQGMRKIRTKRLKVVAPLEHGKSNTLYIC
jgi:hypothetical protein